MPIRRARRKSVEQEEQQQEQIQKKTIPNQQVKEFVGDVNNLLKIDCKHLFDNVFRINVWISKKSENSIYESGSLDRSFVVSYNGLEIADRTNLKQKEL